MLTANEILLQRSIGNIVIEPFNEAQMNPNSYNVRLADELLIYEDAILDPHHKPRTKALRIPPEGLVLQPGQLYIGSTVEYTETQNLIPCIDGRSSVGRLGIFLHVTAGFGDVGFRGRWTLEIAVLRPVRVYPGMEIGQIYYEVPDGEITQTYAGRYQDQLEATASRYFEG